MKNKNPIDILSINQSIPSTMQECFFENKIPIKNKKYNGHMHHDLDSRIVYRINKDGYHGSDFIENPDILALGCSVTAGLGLPYELTWPYLVAKELNETVNVVAIVGAGLDQIFRNALLHIEKFGIPKKVFLLMPDFYRAWIPLLQNDNKYDLTPLLWCFKTKEYLKAGEPIIYKDWHGMHRSIPSEVPGTNALLSLRNFQTFCSIINIEFAFFSWDLFNTNYILSRIKGINDAAVENYFNNLNFFGPLYYTDEYKKVKCHEPYNEHQEIFWDEGLDHPRTHPGMHAHIHYAEMFLEKQISKKTIENSKVNDDFN